MIEGPNTDVPLTGVCGSAGVCSVEVDSALKIQEILS